MIVFMRRHARALGGDLRASAAGALAAGSAAGLVVMAFLAVMREGLETAMFLLAAFQASIGVSPLSAGLGAVLGVLVAVAIGWGIYSGGVRINLARFFRITSVLLVIIAAGLAGGRGPHANEAGCSPPATSRRSTSRRRRAALGLDHDRPHHRPARDLPVARRWPRSSPGCCTRSRCSRSSSGRSGASGRRSGPPSTLAPEHVMKTPTLAAVRAARGPRAGRLRRQRRLVEPARSRRARARKGAKELKVALTDKGCDPATATVPSGAVRFIVSNPGTTKTDEIELKNEDGIIMGERENLAPGLGSNFTLTLQPGKYVLNCTFQNDTRDNGSVTVTGAPTAATASADDRKLNAGRRGLQGLRQGRDRQARRRRRRGSWPR